MTKGTLIALLVIVAGFGTPGKPLLAGQRPFHFSQDKDTMQAKVRVDEANRMIDDIYGQFEGSAGLIKIAKYQALLMQVEFDSISSSGSLHVDTFYCRDLSGHAVKFDSSDRRIFSNTKARWINGAMTYGIGLGYAYFLTDSTFVGASLTQNTWDSVSVLIIGRQK